MALAEAKGTETKMTSCPWGKVDNSTQAPCSFSSLMDEEYAKQIEKEEVELGKVKKQEQGNLKLFNEGSNVFLFICCSSL